jgi:hypothetical protein
MRLVPALGVAILAGACSAADLDPFVGVFESETRANFGTDTQGEWRMEIVTPSKGKYVATLYHSGNLVEKFQLVPCSEDKENYFRGRPPGRAAVLCSDQGGGFLHGSVSYAENGIDVPAVKSRYVSNPELVEKDGLKPGDASLFETRHHAAKYYAHAQWGFYGFRRVSP